MRTRQKTLCSYQRFNTFMYDHTLHRERKHFCRYCLQAFSTKEILKCHIKDCFMTNGKQGIKMPKKSECLRFKACERKIKSSFMIYADFENILAQEDDRKKNLDESYTDKYQKHVAFSFGYKLACVDDQFSKPFKSYLGEDTVYNFINNMIEESTYCSDIMKKTF